MEDSERSPLLSEQRDGFVAYGEAPPPYAEAYSPDSHGALVITCRVCQSPVSVEGKLHQHVVKCNVCKEATPIQNPPQGKKYIRCSCNCLLICKDSSQRISCPRPLCKRVIDLRPLHCDRESPQQQQQHQYQPIGVHVVCGHCRQTFLWSEISDRTLARCPHCRKVSSTSRRYPRRRSLLCFLLFIVLVALTAGLLAGTWSPAQRLKGIYVVWLVAIVVTLVILARAVYWRCLKISPPVTSRV
ncbi:type I phosphatidylinositol 4,5-bisphosphate 4-phosphatase-B-like isoform X2 [Gouania willdenowi]|uniref:type I phosphatidylinositol 4,5-bisphosphate 4-phosphatase-B-like isoform X2 n=1 Tax=Gouania willdenowi TaxID=441366 RepID=UPI001055BA98|nr:type I phosphatidylinositol 4,5-bisphosphate 4-phosphatase-B-like isoform X2 [Gouania willdenowi]